MRIYTKTGDTGETSLLGGKRVKKCSPAIEAMGEVDELNAAMGVLVSLLDDGTGKEQLVQIQHRLFVIGAQIAAVQTTLIDVPVLPNEAAEEIEKWIDEMSAGLAPLTQFVLPGGQLAAAQSLFTRAICRRAERRVVEFSSSYPLSPTIVQYLNRLSDALFVLGRWINTKQGVKEEMWKK